MGFRHTHCSRHADKDTPPPVKYLNNDRFSAMIAHALTCEQVITRNLERVRRVKTRHQRLSTRVATVRDELQRFLEDDDDMAKMCLSRKAALQKAQAGQPGKLLLVSVENGRLITAFGCQRHLQTSCNASWRMTMTWPRCASAARQPYRRHKSGSQASHSLRSHCTCRVMSIQVYNHCQE